jgi:hypothetical protein
MPRLLTTIALATPALVHITITYTPITNVQQQHQINTNTLLHINKQRNMPQLVTTLALATLALVHVAVAYTPMATCYKARATAYTGIGMGLNDEGELTG